MRMVTLWSFFLTRVMKFLGWYLYRILLATSEGILQCTMKWLLWFFIQTRTPTQTQPQRNASICGWWVSMGLRSHGLDCLQLELFQVLRGLRDFGAMAEFSWEVAVGSCFCITTSLNNLRILEFSRLLDGRALKDICKLSFTRRASFPLTEGMKRKMVSFVSHSHGCSLCLLVMDGWTWDGFW